MAAVFGQGVYREVFLESEAPGVPGEQAELVVLAALEVPVVQEELVVLEEEPECLVLGLQQLLSPVQLHLHPQLLDPSLLS